MPKTFQYERFNHIKTHPQLKTILDVYHRYKDQKNKKEINQILFNNYHIDLSYQEFVGWTVELDKQSDLQELWNPSQNELGESLLPGSTLFEKGRVDPVFFAETILKIQLHDGQKEWLRESTLPGRVKNILVPSNQYGKTVITAVKHIWMCFYKIGLPEDIRSMARYETLAISPKLRQVRAFYGYVIEILKGNMWWEVEAQGARKREIRTNEGCMIKEFLVKPRDIPSTQQISQMPIQFSNGAKIHCASTGGDMGAGLAGGQFAFISYDECPLSLNLEEELPTRIMSRLIRYGGPLDLIGTPDADCDSFMYYQRLVHQAVKGEDGWFVHFGKLDDNQFISRKNREQTKKMIKETNPEKYRQVVFGEFVRGGSSVFGQSALDKMWSEGHTATLDPKLGGLIGANPKPSGQYVIGVDWAIAGDYTVMIVMEYSTPVWEIVYFIRFRGKDKPPHEQYMILLELKSRYHASVMMDTCGLGGQLIENEFKDEPDMEGFNFGPGRKAGLIATLKKALYWNAEEGRIKSPYLADLDEELGAYKLDDKRIRQDCVMALALCTFKADQFEFLPEAVDFHF